MIRDTYDDRLAELQLDVRVARSGVELAHDRWVSSREYQDFCALQAAQDQLADARRALEEYVGKGARRH